MVQRVVGVPGPPPQLGSELVEHFVEAVVDESDADRSHDDAAVAEHSEAADDLECQRDHRGIQRHDVERQPLEQELDGEGVVREHHSETVFDAEDVREVQRDLDDEQVDDGGEPQRQVGRVTVTA